MDIDLWYAIHYDGDYDSSGETTLGVFTSVEKAMTCLDREYPRPSSAKKWDWTELSVEGYLTSMSRYISRFENVEIRKVEIDPEPGQ